MATNEDAANALSGTPGRAIFRRAGYDADGLAGSLRLALGGATPGAS